MRGGLLKYFVLTNNPMVWEKVAPGKKVVFERGDMRHLYEKAQSYVARGHRLLTHPLSGSVKPGETPYKSILMTADAASGVDANSCRLLANALDACGKFADKSHLYNEKTLHDLQIVDYSLLEGAIASAETC